MRARVLLALLVSFGALASTPVARRPRVDEEAMVEAMKASRDSGGNYASSASYAHFLSSRLLHNSGDHRRSLDELRLALVTDEGNPYLMTALAEDQALTGDLEKAEKTLRKVIDRAGSYAPAQLLMGEVLAEQGKLARARAHLQKATQLDPAEAMGWLTLAQVELQARRPDQAVEVTEAMARAIPQDARGFRALGAAFAEKGDCDRAERMLRRAVETSSDDGESWQRLAQIYEASGRLAESADAWEQALVAEPDDLELLVNAGRVCLRMDAEDRAKGWFDHALNVTDDPEVAIRISFAWLSADKSRAAVETLDKARERTGAQPRLSFYAGLIYERLREFARAADAYGAVPEGAELYPEARVRRATALSLGGQHAKALEAFKKLSDKSPDSPGVVPPWARALEESGARREAERLLRRAVERWPQPELYDALARNLHRQGRSDDAISLLRSAVAKQPGDVGLQIALGVTFELAGRSAEALPLMREVMARSPDNAAALNFVGYTLAVTGGDLEEAERLVKRALELKPETGAFLDSLGWVAFHRGQYEQAVQYLERAAKLEPDEAVIHDHLGDAYRRASRPEDAMRSWRRALEVLGQSDDPPDGRALKAALERKLRVAR